MANWDVLKTAIANVIKTNGNQEITGVLLQNVLNSIVTSVGENATFAGIATVDTNPGAPDGPVFYLATTAGTYANFSGIELSEGEAAILEWKGSWTKKASGFATQEKLSELNSEIDNLKIQATKADYRERNLFLRKSPNLVDLNALTPKKAINAYGVIYNVANDIDAISDWIHVYPNQPYIISGGYSNTIYSLYKQYGDTQNPISYGKIPLNTPFYFDKEGFVVLQIKDSAIAAAVYATTQFEEGEVASKYKLYSPIVYRKIDERFLPDNLYKTENGKIKVEDLNKDVMLAEEYVIEKRTSPNLIR
mgnify:CR=1 FL=1